MSKKKIYIYILIISSFSAVKVPIAILAAELDNGTPAKQLEEFKSVLSQDKVRIYKLKIIGVHVADWNLQ
jgi:hypothetical protein